MNKFGLLKSKLLQKLTESYVNGDKSEIKKILKTVKEDKNFKDLYLFYEDIENKYIKTVDEAKLYIEEITPIIKEKSRKISKLTKSLHKGLENITINENDLYKNIDILLENNTLKNIDKKISAKTKLIEHLTKEKNNINEVGTTVFTKNENLLHNVLVNDFNVLYSNTLNEEQKEELKKILSITNEELETNFKTLQEEVTKKLDDLSTNEKNEDTKTKLNQALTEAKHMEITKFNYYKLEQLKNGL